VIFSHPPELSECRLRQSGTLVFVFEHASRYSGAVMLAEDTEYPEYPELTGR
jgi:hypothetical protein